MMPDNNNNKTEIKRLQRILMQKPKDMESLMALASIYYTEGDIENAKKHLLKVLTINPNNAEALNNLGSFICRRKKSMLKQKNITKKH
jgi:Tfp pilus assembly protein PilF